MYCISGAYKNQIFMYDLLSFALGQKWKKQVSFQASDYISLTMIYWQYIGLTWRMSFHSSCLFCYLHWFAKTEVLEGHQTHRFISVHTESPHLSNWSWSLWTAERHRSFVIPLLTWNLQAAAGYEKKIQPSRGHIRMSQSLTRQISVLHVMAIWRICTSITLSLIYLTSLHKSCVQ